MTVVRATFRFHDTTPQGKCLYNLYPEPFCDSKSEGRMINRFGKVRLNFESAIVSDGFCLKGYRNY